MAGRIQSIERAAGMLSLIAASPEPPSLAEVADGLGLARPTAHGLLATLVEVGFVSQDDDTRRYSLGPALWTLQQRGVDRHDLRSQAMTWCDSLASRVRTEVLVCVPADGTAEVVHHVFRPSSAAAASGQHRRVGERLPLHATGVGKVLLATSPSPGAAARRGTPELVGYTSRTATTRARLRQEVERTRAAGWGAGYAEHAPDVGDVAAPVRGLGGLAVGAVACVGPVDALFGPDGRARPAVRDGVLRTAAAITHALAEPR